VIAATNLRLHLITARRASIAMVVTGPMHFLIAFLFIVVSVRPVPALAQAGTASSCYAFDRAYFTWVSRAQERPQADSTNVLRLLTTSQGRLRSFQTRVRDVQPVPFVVDSLTEIRWQNFSYWMVNDSGFVEIAWRNGLYGPVFQLSVSRDSLHGQVRSATDVYGAEPPPARAWARRIPCPTD